MSEQEEFHRQMAERPHDRDVRGVYADWLEENGNPQAAQRLRWWTRLHAALERVPDGTPAFIYPQLPHWAQQLATIHRVQAALDALPNPQKRGNLHSLTTNLIASTERHALGLESLKGWNDLNQAARGVLTGALWHAANGGRHYDQMPRMMARVAYAAFQAHQATGPGFPNHLRSAHAWLVHRYPGPDDVHMAPDREGEARLHGAIDDPTKLARGEPIQVPVEDVLPDRENLDIAADSLYHGRESQDTRPLEVYAAGDKYVLADGHHRFLRAVCDGKTHVAVSVREAEKPPSTEGTVTLDPDHEDGKYGLTKSLPRNGFRVRKLADTDPGKTRVSNRQVQGDSFASSPRIIEDLKQYRQQIRPGIAGLHARGDRRIQFNSDDEHRLIHKFVTNRGLKVEKSAYTYYDDASHTLYHPNPEDPVATSKAYVRMVTPGFKLARISGPGAAARATGSGNHQARVSLAKTLLREAGLTPAVAKQVFSHTPEGGLRPAVAAMIASDAPPSVTRFAAAWLGLLLQERAVTVFHPGDGEDTMHVIDSPHPTDHAAEYLKRAGVKSFTLEPKGQGSRAFLVSPMGLDDAKTLATGLQAEHAAIQGTATRLGASGDDAEARANFRQVIDDAEKEAGYQ